MILPRGEPRGILSINHIRKTLLSELVLMMDIEPSNAKDEIFLSIIEDAERSLRQLDLHISNSSIHPTADISVSELTLPIAFYNRALRIGVYPLSANPLHWGHLLIGLSAIAHYQLDKVIFVIAGEDPKKPHLAPATWRHEMTKNIISKFEPFFTYSDIAKNSNLDGEINIFRILGLNPFQKIDAFYIDVFFNHKPQRAYFT